MYWSAASTPNGPPELVVAKWLSVINHVVNIHTGHGHIFTDCTHGELGTRDVQKSWIQPGMSATFNILWSLY